VGDFFGVVVVKSRPTNLSSSRGIFRPIRSLPVPLEWQQSRQADQVHHLAKSVCHVRSSQLFQSRTKPETHNFIFRASTNIFFGHFFRDHVIILSESHSAVGHRGRSLFNLTWKDRFWQNAKFYLLYWFWLIRPLDDYTTIKLQITMRFFTFSWTWMNFDYNNLLGNEHIPYVHHINPKTIFWQQLYVIALWYYIIAQCRKW